MGHILRKLRRSMNAMTCNEDCVHIAVCPVVNAMISLLQNYHRFWHTPKIKTPNDEKRQHPIVKRMEEFLVSNCKHRLSPHNLKKGVTFDVPKEKKEDKVANDDNS